MRHESVLDRVGDTPLVNFTPSNRENVVVHAKLESFNPTGSVKDRAASFVLRHLLETHAIDEESLVVESSSGNFGVALATYCRWLGLRFCCVIDPRINRTNELLIRSAGARVVKVAEPDEKGGFLSARLRAVDRILRAEPKAYWVNQYANPLNASAYRALGEELVAALPTLDFLFVGVSSGGTIAGVSQAVKARVPSCRIVAVDVVGSVIFGGAPGVRRIPGIGSSMAPEVLKNARIDEISIVDELTSIRACHELLQDHAIFAGGSSGSVYAALKRHAGLEGAEVACIFADRGDRYAETIYDPAWSSELLATASGEDCLALLG